MTFALGVVSALGAPFVMTLGFILWDNHWSRTGSAFALNLFKCNLATLGFLVLATTTNAAADSSSSNSSLFSNWNADSVGYLVLSSTIGILIGDWTWLQGLKLLGAKRVILMDSFKPFLAAFWGYMFLDEELRFTALSGIVLTVLGVILVGWERTSGNEELEAIDKITEEPAVETRDNATANELAVELAERESTNDIEQEVPEQNKEANTEPFDEAPHDTTTGNSSSNKLRYGYALSIVNVVLDTYGALLIKEHGTDLSVWEINLIRFGSAGIVMLFLSLALHTWAWWRRRTNAEDGGESTTDNENLRKNENSTDDHELPVEDTSKTYSTPWYSLPKLSFSSWCHVSGGVLLVTFLTPTLSNYALFQIALALAMTLGSVGPLYGLVLGYFLQDQKLTMQATLGTILAVAGIVVLAFQGNLPGDEEEGDQIRLLNQHR